MLEGYIVSLTGDIDDIYAITNKELTEEHGFYSLSLKNCKEVENGYDLYELAKASMNKINILFNNSLDSKSHTIGFKAGWHHALKILGDKKFSEEDVRIAMDRVWDWCEDDKDKDCSSMTELRNKHIQSLQQTEWDVEIVEVEDGEVYSVTDTMKAAHNKAFDGVLFKHDADGCLILKRK